ESYTSQTCSMCGTVDKTNRVYRGLYICKECGVVINADVGALNILKKVSPNSHKGIGVGGFGQPSAVKVSKLTYRTKNPRILMRGVGQLRI
ncbi:MAG: zinc ribbon domain-containing protein, partial [Candidatus Aenigmatarchaeota archaeon]